MVITEETSKKSHTRIWGCNLLTMKLRCLQIPGSGRMQGREEAFLHNLRWRRGIFLCLITHMTPLYLTAILVPWLI